MTLEQRENLKRIHEIAKRVRRAFEVIATRDGKPRNLQGLCGRAAVQLFLECKREGIHIRIANARGYHAFCVYAGHIIDVTATQFHKLGVPWPKVLIKPISKVPYSYHDILAKYRSVFSAVKDTSYVKGLYYAGQCYKKDRKVVIEYRSR